jgi:hypothetical protein
MKPAVLILCFVFPACSTVVPKPVAPVAASFDGNDQTSGVLGSNANGFVVTNHFRDRYNALVAIYGRDFAVPLTPDAGFVSIEDERWLVDRQHLAQFLEMQAWQRAGLKPKTP